VRFGGCPCSLARGSRASTGGVAVDCMPFDSTDVNAPHPPHEASIVAELHAQAAGIQNTRSLVTVVLDPASNYARWRDHVHLTLQCYALDDHVLTDSCLPAPSWCSHGQCGSVLDPLHYHCRAAGHRPRAWWHCSSNLGCHRGPVPRQP
jgi:hypothetical protein